MMMMIMIGGVNASSGAMHVTMPSLGICGSVNGKEKTNNLTATTRIAALEKRRLSISPACSALEESRNLPRASFFKEVLEAARDNFTQEISFQSKDKDLSLAKALLYVAIEDKVFLAFNREMDALSLHNERKDTSSSSNVKEWDCLEAVPLAGKNINEWLVELDAIGKEIKAELISRDIGCHLVEVIDAVNKVLFELRGFKRSSVLVDSKCLYLHSVLSSKRASAILLGVIYIEVCRRLNLTIVGSQVGEEFFTLKKLLPGKIKEVTLQRLHWKQASRTNYGLTWTSPIRLATMASERLLILQPHNWAFRRDYGMMLYYSRDYKAAVQELSICMAFAPEEEAEVLEPFVEKLHLMRLE
ncbi:Hypothetical predicted protein [Olea europaea subsp. europaea]|uniref:Protein SirB1 N-terminal domain-containing protein n=1 Tax=Olea europaea subsp. europaea TaxID=158383 RepID=A0A8S0PU35_OLEEU|nr:Hypothetical predicted protein [Olea europaea subsp. europaea]